MNKITLSITTYNRAHLWRQLFLYKCLVQQTEKPDELIVVDDNSNDGTVELLQELLANFSTSVRLFQCTAPKLKENQASALPENIIIKEAKHPILIHADDDGWFDINCVKWVKQLGLQEKLFGHWRVVYGNLVCVKPDTMEPFWYDAQGGRKYGNGFCPMLDNNRWLNGWGCLWAAPIALLREIGGQDMTIHQYRGQDTRLAWRLHQLGVDFYWGGVEAFRFHHIGEAWARKVHGSVRLQHTRNPYHNKEMQKLPPIVNGGESFWTSGALDGLYKEIPIIQ